MKKENCQRSATNLHDFELIEDSGRVETYYTSTLMTLTSPPYMLEVCTRCGYRLVTYTNNPDQREFARMHARDFLQPADWRYRVEYGEGSQGIKRSLQEERMALYEDN